VRRRLLVTAPSRTLLDLAEVLTQAALERAFAETQLLGLARRDELFAQLERSPGRHGAAAIRDLLHQDSRPAPTRCEAEARLLAVLRAAGLPPTDVNARVGRYEVDFLWRPERLIVEIDGFAYHASRAAFERDRLRDAELQAAGYRVIRITWRQLEAGHEAVIARLAQALVRA
jgi:very-short-patch-repair endonuclease